jgi:phosphoribosylformimino-5-aminoimidazole carboxamide ribotide isomerase
MMQGYNMESTRALANAIQIPVIASGGVTNYDDIRSLCTAEDDGVMGAIVGRAIYEGTIDLAKGQALADELNPPQSY